MNCELCNEPTAGYLCRACELDTADRLERLPEMFDDLATLGIRGRALEATRRGSRPAFSPTPDLKPMAIRWGFNILPSWHSVLAEDSGWPMQHTGFALGGEDDRILGACIALRASAAWIAAAWPAAGAFAEEVRDLFDDVRQVLRLPDLPRRMGPCPAKHDGVLCGAPLQLPRGQQVIRCAWCEATYPPGVWAALRSAQRFVSSAASPVGAEARPSRG